MIPDEDEVDAIGTFQTLVSLFPFSASLAPPTLDVEAIGSSAFCIGAGAGSCCSLLATVDPAPFLPGGLKQCLFINRLDNNLPFSYC